MIAVKQGIVYNDVYSIFESDVEFCKEIFLNSVKYNIKDIWYDIPKKILSYELCLKVVKQNGRAICCVPREMRTREVSWEAVIQNGETLKYVPEEFKTESLILKAVSDKGLGVFNDIPKKMLSNEFLKKIRHNL